MLPGGDAHVPCMTPLAARPNAEAATLVVDSPPSPLSSRSTRWPAFPSLISNSARDDTRPEEPRPPSAMTWLPFMSLEGKQAATTLLPAPFSAINFTGELLPNSGNELQRRWSSASVAGSTERASPTSRSGLRTTSRRVECHITW